MAQRRGQENLAKTKNKGTKTHVPEYSQNLQQGEGENERTVPIATSEVTRNRWEGGTIATMADPSYNFILQRREGYNEELRYFINVLEAGTFYSNALKNV